MKNEVIQRLGYVAGEIVKGYAGKSTQQGSATGGMSENVTDMIIDQVINALGGGRKGGQGGGGGGGCLLYTSDAADE